LIESAGLPAERSSRSFIVFKILVSSGGRCAASAVQAAKLKTTGKRFMVDYSVQREEALDMVQQRIFCIVINNFVCAQDILSIKFSR